MGDPTLLAITGELDLYTTSQTGGATARTPSIRILDLSGVSFIDPAGLRVLLDVIRADPQLVVRAASACVRRLCTIAGLDDLTTPT